MLILWILLFLCSSSINVVFAGAADSSGDVSNPFTPKAYLIRYWSQKIQSKIAKSNFLLSKLSPLDAVDSAAYTKLAAQNALSLRLPDFCAAAKLFCFPDLAGSLEKHDKDSNFRVYSDRNFTSYATKGLGGAPSFKNYSENDSIIVHSGGHDDQSDSYALGETLWARASTPTAPPQPVVPGQKFTAYTANTNAGNGKKFTSYGKNGHGSQNKYKNDGTQSNVIRSIFSNYAEAASGANDTSTSNGFDANVPLNDFKVYGGGNATVDRFTTYGSDANVPENSFKRYGEGNATVDSFPSYGSDGHVPEDSFKQYGEGNATIDSFPSYGSDGIAFASYKNGGSAKRAHMAAATAARWVEPGKFFRESMLKKGTVMPMPDIRDKMPKRMFLPRTIISKLPFSSPKIAELKNIFHAADNSSLESIMLDALRECERAPSAGETKRCVGSAEDMIDFATSILNRNVALRTTENTNGSKKKIMIGSVKGINGGKVTESVSCHQSLYPYLLYYCHSVPAIKVYEAEILDPHSREKMNHGVAICHFDTSAWSAGHGAFLALGSGPGRIEVCHWTFENDLIWTIAD
ncbi:hypothetical protein SLA2020_238330 [Shorea laevis]